MTRRTLETTEAEAAALAARKREQAEAPPERRLVYAGSVRGGVRTIYGPRAELRPEHVLTMQPEQETP